jgi:ubiquitin-conjugating enzyme E2 R
MYRRWKDSKGKDAEYANIIKKQVAGSRAEAEKDNVVVPMTIEDYCIKSKPPVTESLDMNDFYDDCYDIGDEDSDDYADDDDEADGADDSGNENA